MPLPAAAAPGAYEVQVLLDENAFDDDDNFLHIRGSPFQVTRGCDPLTGGSRQLVPPPTTSERPPCQ